MRMKEVTLTLGFSVLMLFLGLGCGGSKQTVTTPLPDPFPKADSDSTTTEPATQPVEEVNTTEPTADTRPKKQPLVLNTVYFEYDKAELTSEARARLAENARQLQANPDVKIRIEGHCDERGTVEYNLALGERRALATQNYLINFGIKPDRISIVSYGKERPVDPRHTPEAWQKNRRAEFVKLN